MQLEEWKPFSHQNSDPMRVFAVGKPLICDQGGALHNLGGKLLNFRPSLHTQLGARTLVLLLHRVNIGNNEKLANLGDACK